MGAQALGKQGPTVAEEVARARELSLGGLFIALGIVIPIALHALGGGKLGSTLLPMYLPVLACAMLVSAPIAAAVGLLTPVLSSALTGMPPILPVLPLMVAELTLMALIGSLLHRRLKLHALPAVALALLAGRVVMGLMAALLVAALPAGLQESLPPIMRTPVTYVLAATVAALPGLALQIVAVPSVVALVERRRGRTVG
ncbi:MAG TPA: ECF transporter S component [Armatimonadetes bacterium]|nr:ECF transporter S component [Armatimonadota bacterium]